MTSWWLSPCAVYLSRLRVTPSAWPSAKVGWAGPPEAVESAGTRGEDDEERLVVVRDGDARKVIDERSEMPPLELRY
jgi:hypothetical protein